MESAFNVQTITISMQMECAAKWNLNVKISTDKLEFVKPATKDMESSMDNVSEPIWSTQTELDAKLGPVENVLNAQSDGTSMPQEFAEPFLLNADHGLPPVNAILVIQAMLLLKDDAFKIQTHSYQLPTISVQFGRIESVFNVLIELSSTQMEFVNKYQPNALHGMLLMESAWLASTDTT